MVEGFLSQQETVPDRYEIPAKPQKFKSFSPETSACDMWQQTYAVHVPGENPENQVPVSGIWFAKKEVMQRPLKTGRLNDYMLVWPEVDYKSIVL